MGSGHEKEDTPALPVAAAESDATVRAGANDARDRVPTPVDLDDPLEGDGNEKA